MELDVLLRANGRVSLLLGAALCAMHPTCALAGEVEVATAANNTAGDKTAAAAESGAANDKHADQAKDTSSGGHQIIV